HRDPSRSALRIFGLRRLSVENSLRALAEPKERSRPRLRTKDSRDTTLQKPRPNAGEGACAPDPTRDLHPCRLFLLFCYLVFLNARNPAQSQAKRGKSSYNSLILSSSARIFGLLFVVVAVIAPYPSCAQQVEPDVGSQTLLIMPFENAANSPGI